MENFDKLFMGIDEKGAEREFLLSDFKEPLVLYFYPKDNTPGCTQEACDFRDNVNRLTSKATVVGVSPDSIASHKNFQKKYSLNFPLLSDPEYILCKDFNVWQEKQMYGKMYKGIERSTFIIKDGKIAKEWRKVNVKGHVDEVLQSL
jgi:peroxiredoxin Q/BCP